MKELLAILHDLLTGALPLAELPRFIRYLNAERSH